ncbi:hypothetical protein RS81_00932 [Microbacterium terrae]|uniref:ABC-2 family transporter protein n=1 Tax=Microbacterium terrae TaxID=69369 RepID=A0A0M2H9Q9_9MICO|nr:hypothetical protein [Microbacterium terrae]KJL43327.1 hypothetical protein RS81_00932 [Microbacterium terrae]
MSTAPELERTPWWRLPLIAVGISLIVGDVLLAFSWPAVTAEAQDLPIGIVGSADQIDQVADAIDEQSDGAIALTEYDDRDAAVTAIEQRLVYGAVVIPAEQGDAPEVLTATAASPLVAQMLQGIAQEQQAQIDAQIRAGVEENLAALQQSIAEKLQAIVQAVLAGQMPELPGADAEPVTIPTISVAVTDVVPFADADPRGAGLSAAMFPMVIGGMLGGIAITLLVKGGGLRRVVAVAIYAPVAGLVLAGILHGLYGALQGTYLLNASAIALAIAAISSTITGLAGLIGPAGVGLGAAFTMLVANPLSAATVPVEFIPAPWGAFGQWLAPGAAATLIRSLSYFPGADVTFPWLVLAGWTVAGIALTLIDIPARRLAAGETAAAHPLTV